LVIICILATTTANPCGGSISVPTSTIFQSTTGLFQMWNNRNFIEWRLRIRFIFTWMNSFSTQWSLSLVNIRY